MKNKNYKLSKAIVLLLLSCGFISQVNAGPTISPTNPSPTPTIGTSPGDLGDPPPDVTSVNMISTGMTVGASISPVCNLQTSNIYIGNYNPTAPGSTYSTVNISIICTKNTSASLKIDGGQNSNGTDRFMLHTNGIDKLKYRLIDGATYIDIPINTTYSNITGLGVQQLVQLTASIPPKQSLPAGNYSDTIVFSVEY